ncbi:hypothetical protein ACFQ1E_20120 [Sphingomonas canadensis]|uniref:Right handed beta helix domain-containing protein n=1 Tax=Sphingomonas canadensis TaxID=1219257 RepID=A0ABW3HBU3_9SPHN|nr:hypothetical protein [Sphingomonas canadensis]MCW3838436.1 hypothetical protein [Sphingomonas canadensis]
MGDDANPCSRTAPCKTFAGAISKTAAGGEINCLDSGGFGSVTITKSITLLCQGVIGGILASGTNGINVNAASTDVVVIKGLDIEGFGTGLYGIRVISAGSVHVYDTIISDFRASTSGGILVAPTAAVELFVNNVRINNSGVAGTGSGIELAPGAGGSVRAVITNSVIADNVNNGIRLNTANGPVSAVIENTDISGNVSGLVVLSLSNAGSATLTRSSVSGNTTGVLAAGGAGVVRLGDNTISANTTGVSAVAGASAISFGTNRLAGNTTNGAFTSTTPQQ